MYQLGSNVRFTENPSRPRFILGVKDVHVYYTSHAVPAKVRRQPQSICAANGPSRPRKKLRSVLARLHDNGPTIGICVSFPGSPKRVWATFSSFQVFLHHVLQAHLILNYCSRGSAGSPPTPSPEAIPSGRKTFCDLCNWDFKKVFNYNKHCKDKHEKVRFSCRFRNCRKSFSRHAYRNTHERVHRRDFGTNL